MKAPRYKAFMSYCHADEYWASWLHRALESYRVPKRLAGKPGLHGRVPASLSPIFRDRDELSSATDLSEKIREALAESGSLLVICSPEAARSRWVNEEIRLFRSLGGSRIYCMIVAGDPRSSDPKNECFPPALFDGEDQKSIEPLAADVRKWADGKSLARLKLVAGILGVRLDELRQRQQQRKRRLQLVAGVAVLFVMVLLFSSIKSRMNEREARLAQETQQASAEGMLAQFLQESERLGDVADLETRKAFGEVMAGYFASLDPKDLTFESRRQLGVALSNRGVILRAEGDMEQAMKTFQNAHRTLQLLVDDSKDDPYALFELSQVQFWVGQVHLDLGRLDLAGTWFEAYSEVSEALHNMQADNADWTMEVAYAKSNLANLERQKIPSDPLVMLQYSKAALKYNEEAARQDPAYERELTDSHADLADAWLGVCDLAQATDHRLKGVELAARHFHQNPASNRIKEDYANALSGLFWVQQQTGDVELALSSLQQALNLLEELVREDPSNLRKRWNRVMKSAYQAQLLQLSGDDTGSWGLSVVVEQDMRKLTEQDRDLQVYLAIEYGMFLRDFSYRAYLKGETVLAARLLEGAFNQLTRIADKHPDNKKVLNELALSYFYLWNRDESILMDGTASSWLRKVKDASNQTACSDLNIGSRLSLMADERDQAQVYVSQLIESGYQEPEFKRFCIEYGLCESNN